MSLSLATEIGSPENLMQYRMISADTGKAWFAKGTFAPSLKNTLAKFELAERSELADIDLIVPTSSLKGTSKQNLSPGVHQQMVHLSNHDRSHEVNFSLRAVAEKLDGDSLTSLIKQQSDELEKLNEIFATSDSINQEFLHYLQPQTMPDPDNPEVRIKFDPERWQECGDWKYIIYRKDLEGHQQLINSPIFAQDKHKFYASRARKAAQLSFIKAKGGMIFCSHELSNNQVCVPGLPDGAKVAAIRSPIIKLQDIALVENKLIDDIYNDAGQIIEGAIICSSQQFDALLNQTKLFMQEQSQKLSAAQVDTADLDLLNPWQKPQYEGVVLANLEGPSREELIGKLNTWREAYNALVVEVPSSHELLQIRQDTFTSIIKGDFDGDTIAILPQSDYPAIYAGIESRIQDIDSYTTKLEKIKVIGDRTLPELLADKADLYSLGKTANLAENLQSFVVAAERVEQLGSPAQQEAYLKDIAPSFYYLMANPTAREIKTAEAAKLPSTFRYYDISSTGERLIDPALVHEFDAYGLDKALLQLQQGESVDPVVRTRLFATWQKLLISINDVVAQQNQIAVDTFKSERPIDQGLIEGLTRRLRILDDGLKKSLKNNQTYLFAVPQIKNNTTNRSLLVANVNQNLVAYNSSETNYKQIQDLFPQVVDENILQDVAVISHEYDKLTSLSSSLREKARIDNGPSLTFVDDQGRGYEVTNIMSYEHTVKSLKKELKEGKTDIRIEPNTDENSSHKFFASYRVGGDWKKLGTVCNACAKQLELKPEKSFDLVEVTTFDFASSSAIHLANSYSQTAYRKATEFRAKLSPEEVDTYAAATYQYLSKSTSQGNRMGLMFQIFGPELAAQVESLELKTIKLDNLTGVALDSDAISVMIQTDEADPLKNAVMQETEKGLVKLGTISGSSHQLRPGTKATAEANYLAPSVADFTLPTGETLTVGGMAKSIFPLAGTILANESLEMEVGPGEAISYPVIKIGARVVGRLKDESIKYLEDNQLLNTGQELDLTLTSVGTGRYQKLKAVTNNGQVLEIVNLKDAVKQPRSNELVKASIGFEPGKAFDQLYVDRQGKKLAAGNLILVHQVLTVSL